MTYPSTVKYLLLGKETSWGSGGTANKDCGLIIKDVSTPLSREVSEQLGISSIQTQKITAGMVDPKVNISGDFQHGRLLEYLIGSVGHATTGSDTEHTFTVSDTPPSALIETGNNMTTDTTLSISGCIAEKGEIRCSLNEVLQLSVDFTGKTPTTGSSASSAVTSTLITFPHSMITVEVNTVAATEVQEFTISIDKVVPKSGGMGSNTFQQGHATELKFKYTAKLGFSAKTYHDLFVNGTVHEFEILATNGVTLGSGKRSLNVVLENCINTDFNEVARVGELTFVDISGVGTLKTCISTDNIASGSW